MFIIVGLGNPGRRFAGTRHNIGYDVVDALAKKHKIKVKSLRHRALMGNGEIFGNKVFFVKPLTYMNASGECVRRVIDYYKADEKSELLVIADDISLATGKLRMRVKGSSGGHKGLQNIIENLGHNEFLRLKIGVGDKPAGDELIDHVLGRFEGSEAEIMREATENAAAAIECILTEGVEKAMNKYNSKKDNATS
jgi:PTH1 family peptidyl-tRNA hydrolase